MMLSTQLTHLRQPPSHQTPTPPDSPTPSQTQDWFQPVVNQEARIEQAQPLRSTRQRRVSVTVSWPKKRLFTPDIKRTLKSWLIRRRDNPYPSRAEKQSLASTTGLTYMQICNWFANWRRKLRKSATSSSATTGTWGRLIKRYNATACAAAEQFSISSDDSIWGGETPPSPFVSPRPDTPSLFLENRLTDSEVSGDCSVSVTVPVRSRTQSHRRRRRRRRRPPPAKAQRATPLLSKWLENAAISLPWPSENECTSTILQRQPAPEELVAAEALTRLSVVIGECHQCAALC